MEIELFPPSSVKMICVALMPEAQSIDEAPLPIRSFLRPFVRGPRGPRGETLSFRLMATFGGGTGYGGARTNTFDDNATMATNPDRRAGHGRRVAEVLDCGLPARVGHPRQLQRQGEEGLQQAGQQRNTARFPAVRKGEGRAGTVSN